MLIAIKCVALILFANMFLFLLTMSALGNLLKKRPLSLQIGSGLGRAEHYKADMMHRN